MKSKIQLFTLLIAMVGLLGACDTFRDDFSADSYSEAPKEMSGTWQLKTVSRNGSDISDAMDFSQFKLHMNSDNTYSLENYLPFIVEENGTWAVDDPVYPFALTFQEEGGEPVTVEISYPIVEGKRNITLTLSPGCYSNSYVYAFEKVDNE